MEFTPRLMQILFLLLNTVEPIPAGKLAQQLQISKRTIFRELDHVDVQLEKYGLKLNRKSGIGFELEGSLESKYKLLEDFKKIVIILIREIEIRDNKSFFWQCCRKMNFKSYFIMQIFCK